MEELLSIINESVNSHNVVKITLSKPYQIEMVKVVVRPVNIKGEDLLNFHYTYPTNDKTKNLEIFHAVSELEQLSKGFKAINLFTSDNHFTYLVNKKGKGRLLKTKNKDVPKPKEQQHDRVKYKRAPLDSGYLFHLGVTTKEGQLVPKMSDKYRQINKYLEIIDDMLKTYSGQSIRVVDMGSGKGYLTFALYDFLTKKGLEPTVIGVEYRQDLVDKCNDVAEKCGFKNLSFEKNTIQDYQDEEIDLLIALHACDTATDDAIHKGLVAQSKYVVCAPCCHKQLRQSTKGQSFDNPLMKFGIFQERQFEMLTDTIRALILESEGYKTKVFEFISNEHTRKNVMLIGEKRNKKVESTSTAFGKISELKQEFNLDQHYLETLLDNK